MININKKADVHMFLITYGFNNKNNYLSNVNLVYRRGFYHDVLIWETKNSESSVYIHATDSSRLGA